MRKERFDTMTDTLRWGILATGSIAHKFATGIAALDDAEIVAVGSRSREGADKFADEFDIPDRHDSYEALAADPDVDAIYIATPHSLHKENMLTCLAAGKAVLCEKPFAINAREAREAIDFARERGIFLMEAMWTRYIPLMVEVRRMVADGMIGDLRMITGDFGYRAGFNAERRTFNPALGGGALLDVGIYPLSLASMLLGKPQRIASMAELGETGVDEQSAMILGYLGRATGRAPFCRTHVHAPRCRHHGHGRIDPHPPALLDSDDDDAETRGQGSRGDRDSIRGQRLQL